MASSDAKPTVASASTALPPTLPRGWEKKLTEKYRQTLSTKRMQELSRTSSRHSISARRQHDTSFPPRHGSGTPQQSTLDDFALGQEPNSYSSLRNIPLMATAPYEASQRQFRSQLHMLSETPMRWENPGLLDEAMKAIPLEQIYAEADEETQLLAATAESIGKKPAWSHQDCVIRALLKWFKRSFFQWVNNPACSRCDSPTIAVGGVAPSDDERALGASRVELYRCSLTECSSFERFPRYNDAFVLLQTRRGRCGEWANCFSMLCRAIGSRVRWVWNSEDHVWTEVFSEYRRRWVHVDACEEAFDKPLVYNEGWNKKLGYCIAFSRDGVTDVTSRYCRNPRRYGERRTRVPEAVLLHILDEIRNLRRKDMEKDERFRLEGEDMREGRELRHYFISTLVKEVAALIPNGKALTPDEQKVADGRQSGSAEWLRARGEDGTPRHRRRQ